MKDLIAFFSSLAIAGFVAMILLGCGNPSPQALVESAKTFSAKGDYKAAAIQLRNALQKQPENAEARYLLGQALNEEMDYVSAEKELRKALEHGYAGDEAYSALSRAVLWQRRGKEFVAEFKDRKLKDPEAAASVKTDLGLAYIGLSQTVEAREAFDAALNAKPGYGRARVGQALLAAIDNDTAGAMKIVDEVLGTSPSLIDALSLKADLLLAQGDNEGAIKVAEQMVKVRPVRADAHYALASLLITERRFENASAEIAAMKKAFPGDVRVHYLEALMADRQGDPARTRDAVQQVLKVMPRHGPSLLLAGFADYQLKSFESAAEYLRQALKQYPQSTYTQSLLISTYLSAGKPEMAQAVAEQALQNAPNDPKLLGLAGEAAIANNQLAKASEYYVRAAALDRDSAVTRVRLARVRLALGDTDRAMKDLELASDLDPGGYQSDLALVETHLRRKEFDKALEALRVLEKKQPNTPLVYNVKGVIYGEMRDYKNARANFAKAQELQFDSLPAARGLAQLDIIEKDPVAARGRFEAIIAKQPKNEEAILELAHAQAATGASPKEVMATMERAIGASPDSITAKLALANFQLQNNDAASALTILQGVAATNPRDTRILGSLALAQQLTGQTNQAIATYNKIATLHPTAAEPLRRLAAVHSGVKQYDASIQALRRALALEPGSLDTRRELIAVEIVSGNTSDALAEARAIQKERPKEAIGFALEGDIYAAQNKWDAAGGAYREAMKRQPMADTLTRLLLALNKQGKATEAKALATNWVREHPKDANVRTYLAERALQDKNFKEAVKLYQEILPLQPENPAVLNNLAWAAMETKDPGALGYAEKAYVLAPDNASILDTYALLLLQKGDARRAVELLTTAVDKAPKSAELRVHLARALIEAADKAAARKQIETVLTLEPNPQQRAEAEQLLKGL